MYVEVRVGKSSRKYYLTHSYKLHGESRKIRIYLGQNLSADELKKRKKAAMQKMLEKIAAVKRLDDPYIAVVSPEEALELKTLNSYGKVKLAHLSSEDWQKFTEAFTYDTNAIEGSTIDRAEVRHILEKDDWPDKSKEDIKETYGVAEAVKYIRGIEQHISIDLIKKLHEIVFKNSKLFAGKLREKGMEVVVVNSLGEVVHKGAPSAQVLSLLRELVKWYGKNRSRYHAVVLAAVVHNRFEMIHPFQDGNGRVGRLLLINILLKHGLPPVNIELKNRKRYYEAIRLYENDKDLRPMIELILLEYRKLKSVVEGDHHN